MWIEQHTTDEGAWYAVAETIGGCTVEELKARMGYREFHGWVVYLNDKEDDLRHRRG